MKRVTLAMSPNDSIFFDEWQACLRAHYMHVIRTNDTITEPTLRSVLLATGLSEDELDALREQALGGEGETHEAAESVEAAADVALAPVEAPQPDEYDLPQDDLTLEDAPSEDEAEPVPPAELGTDLAPVEPVAELPAEGDEPDADFADADEDAPPDDEPDPYAPPPNQLSLF